MLRQQLRQHIVGTHSIDTMDSGELRGQNVPALRRQWIGDEQRAGRLEHNQWRGQQSPVAATTANVADIGVRSVTVRSGSRSRSGGGRASSCGTAACCPGTSSATTAGGLRRSGAATIDSSPSPLLQQLLGGGNALSIGHARGGDFAQHSRQRSQTADGVQNTLAAGNEGRNGRGSRRRRGRREGTATIVCRRRQCSSYTIHSSEKELRYRLLRRDIGGQR